ncbi:MAG: maleylpyruvate isomerase family mycothiol-dependent enzyme [Mycolicibacterium rufum]|nr:maleylpyruvate isomerase family mycothiol-dependent enzyme [Mycolicibacterium rufum]
MRATNLATDERRDFADLVAGLGREQWLAPSLCAGWRVRDVAAHVVAYLDRDRSDFVRTPRR